MRLTGHVWSQMAGWIVLDPSPGVYVANDGNGNLSGFAWGEGMGYIDFSGVTIDTDGYFHGFATDDAGDRISFNCANTDSCAASDFSVRTSWRPTVPAAGVVSGNNESANLSSPIQQTIVPGSPSLGQGQPAETQVTQVTYGTEVATDNLPASARVLFDVVTYPAWAGDTSRRLWLPAALALALFVFLYLLWKLATALVRRWHARQTHVTYE